MSDRWKRQAAAAALDYVRPGMRLGLGTGSTANWFLRLLAEKIREGLEIQGVATSPGTERLARELGIPLTTLDAVEGLDLAVDGADEIDDAATLIKGGGGALLREKIVASDARALLIIADAGKQVPTLGAFPLPIEMIPFGAGATLRRLKEMARALSLPDAFTLRTGQDGARFITPDGNWIVDAHFRQIRAPHQLAAALSAIPGVVEHGLFIDLASTILIAGENGVTRITRPDISLSRSSPWTKVSLPS